MKTIKTLIAIMLFAAFLSSCGEKSIEIEQKGDMFFEKKTNELYSGTCTEMYDNGKTLYMGQIIEGKKEGLWVWYHENGLKSIEENYSSGVLNGSRIVYDENGKQKNSVEYRNGYSL